MSEKAAIEEAIAGFKESYDAGDLDGILNYYSDDLIKLRHGAPAESKAELAARVAQVFENYHSTVDVVVDEVLSSGEPNFPFCLSWANETWSRRWHGAGNPDEVLIGLVSVSDRASRGVYDDQGIPARDAGSSGHWPQSRKPRSALPAGGAEDRPQMTATNDGRRRASTSSRSSSSEAPPRWLMQRPAARRCRRPTPRPSRTNPA